MSALLDEIIRLGQESPEKVAKCVYIVAGEAECIVAQAVVNVGLMTIEELNEFELKWFTMEDEEGNLLYETGNFISLNRFYESEKGFPLVPANEVNVIGNMQFAQDRGNTWGEAINAHW